VMWVLSLQPFEPRIVGEQRTSYDLLEISRSTSHNFACGDRFSSKCLLVGCCYFWPTKPPILGVSRIFITATSMHVCIYGMQSE